MVDEVTTTEELPTIPKEELKTEETTEVPTTDVDALITELEKAGVTKPEQLQGKLVASKEAGNLSNQLGDARREIAELRDMLTSKPAEKEFEPNDDEGADLRTILRQEIEADRQRQTKVQIENQRKVNAMWNEIQGDEDYHLVKDVWEEQLKDSDFIFNIQQGKTNPVKAYNDVVRKFYKGIAKKSVDTIKTLQSGGKVTTPQVIDGETHTPSIPVNGKEIPEGKEVIKQLGEKLDKGELLNEEDELNAIGAALKG